MDTSSTPRPSLVSLTFDVLLAIFRELDTRDVVRIGMTCRDFYEFTKERRVWWDQAQNWYKRNPVLKLSASRLDSSPIDDLRDFAVRQSRLRLRWGQSYEPTGRHTSNDFLKYTEAWLMPGGNVILFVSAYGNVALHRVTSHGTRLSVERDPFVSHPLESSLNAPVLWAELLNTVSPYPILACMKGQRIHLFAIDYEHGRICPETIILPVPRYLPFAVLRGQGRVLGFIPAQPSAVNSERAKIVVVHLDYPETTLEIPLPRTAAQILDMCLTRQHVVVASMHQAGSIHLYKLPDFSTLRRGMNTLREPPPLVIWLTLPEADQRYVHTALFGAHIYNEYSETPCFYLHFWGFADGCRTLLTWRVDPSVTGSPVAEVSEIPLPQCAQATTSEGVLYLMKRRLETSNLYITLISERMLDDWERTLEFNLPTELQSGVLGPRFDLVSGRILITSTGVSPYSMHVYLAEVV